MKEELKHKIIISGEAFPICETDDNGNRVIRASHRYYVANLNTYNVSSNFPHTYTSRNIFRSTFAVGSQLCSFGVLSNQIIQDDHHRTYSACSFDFKNPGLGWKTIHYPPLSRGDFAPLGVEFQGNIYVLQGSGFCCRCEVFDLQRNQWSRFKSPPPHKKNNPSVSPLTRPHLIHKILKFLSQKWHSLWERRSRIYVAPPVLADLTNDRIIAWFDYGYNASLLYAYYPNEDRWEIVAEDFRGWCHQLDDLVILVEGVIYVFSVHCVTMRGFDLSTGKWFHVCIPPDHETWLRKGPNFRYKSLLHGGNGQLCLLGSASVHREPWERAIDSTSSFKTIVGAVGFKVEIRDKKPCLIWLSSTNLDLNDYCNIFHYLLV